MQVFLALVFVSSNFFLIGMGFFIIAHIFFVSVIMLLIRNFFSKKDIRIFNIRWAVIASTSDSSPLHGCHHIILFVIILQHHRWRRYDGGCHCIFPVICFIIYIFFWTWVCIYFSWDSYAVESICQSRIWKGKRKPICTVVSSYWCNHISIFLSFYLFIGFDSY